MTQYRCPHCSGIAIKQGDIIHCEGEDSCKFSGTEEEFEVLDFEFLCIHCGQPLVIKKAMGQIFFGCSGFPKCKGKFPVDAEGGPCFDKTSTKPRTMTSRKSRTPEIER